MDKREAVVEFRRHPENPILTAGGPDWRRCVTFNPGVLFEDGKWYLYERAAGELRPFICQIGMLESEDGVNFVLSREEPVVTPVMMGSQYGSVQDPRVIKMEGRYWMTFAYRPYAWSSCPTGLGVPASCQTDFPGFSGDPRENQTRSGLCVSDNLYDWEFYSWVTEPEVDDRDVLLFPEKIQGRYWALRRPLPYVDSNHKGPMKGSIQISWSEDLRSWSKPEVLLEPQFWWESNRIGGSTPPIRTEKGWLVFHHGVETVRPDTKTVVYRLGAFLLDLGNPCQVVGRCSDYLMEPEAYYERFGTYIPNVVFPTAAVVKEGKVHLYYGACDTAICLATCPLEDILACFE